MESSKSMAIYNSAVCNCHKEDEFTPLMNLVEMGYLYLDKTKKKTEQISFGFKLRKELEKFKKKFVPHMKEEEEQFQPLLFKHFTIDELKEMKNTVIKLHLQKQKRNLDNIRAKTSKQINLELLPISKYFISNLNESERNKSSTYNENNNNDSSSISFNDLPDEIILHIFSFLSFNDKFKATRVCKKWYNTIYDPKNWNELCFDQWHPNINLSESIFNKTRSENIQFNYFENEFENESKELNRGIKSKKLEVIDSYKRKTFSW